MGRDDPWPDSPQWDGTKRGEQREPRSRAILLMPALREQFMPALNRVVGRLFLRVERPNRRTAVGPAELVTRYPVATMRLRAAERSCDGFNRAEEGAHRPAPRISTPRTDIGCQRPPWAAAIPRAFSASASSASVVAPVPWICRMIGSTLAANWSAFTRREATPLIHQVPPSPRSAMA